MDATIDKENHRVGLGAMIRNDKGDIVAITIRSSNFNEDVSFAEAEAEAEAIEWGMQVAASAGLRIVILESDCQLVIDLVNNRKGSKTEIFGDISLDFVIPMPIPWLN